MASGEFSVGKQFASYDEFVKQLAQMERSENTNFARKNTKLHLGNEKLKIAYALVRCEFGGTYVPAGNKIRQASSKKVDCPAYFRIKGDLKLDKLVITESKLQHDHPQPKITDEESSRSDESMEGESSSNRRRRKTAAKNPKAARRAKIEPIMADLTRLLVQSASEESFEIRLAAVAKLRDQLEESDKDSDSDVFEKKLGGSKQTREFSQNRSTDKNENSLSLSSDDPDFKASHDNVRNDVTDDDLIAAADKVEEEMGRQVFTVSDRPNMKTVPASGQASTIPSRRTRAQQIEEASNENFREIRETRGTGKKSTIRPKMIIADENGNSSSGENEDLTTLVLPTGKKTKAGFTQQNSAISTGTKTVDPPFKRAPKPAAIESQKTLMVVEKIPTPAAVENAPRQTRAQGIKVVSIEDVPKVRVIHGTRPTSAIRPEKLIADENGNVSSRDTEGLSARVLPTGKKTKAGFTRQTSASSSTKTADPPVKRAPKPAVVESQDTLTVVEETPISAILENAPAVNVDENLTAPGGSAPALRTSTTEKGARGFEAGSGHDLASIVMPAKVLTKGRPKGHVLTAIGLPKKSQQPVKFGEKSADLQIREILSWLVDGAMIEPMINHEYQVRKEDLKLKDLKDSIVDDAVNLSLLSPFFEATALETLKKAVAQKKKKDIYKCGRCSKRVVDDCVFCDQCLLWHHYHCVNLKIAPKSKAWFCPQCTRTK